ncbi:ABC transporter substrate-binding protein [Actinomadura xylanilytica]|uniref:ABC transporter substrate-binding protein n=1 Tax=Actinomadura xylanilytica TaxID=887459 RepID=UPI00255B079A|nr:ABC transporter substrate-binding protein [Actinomadura xylanilytica]MDL4771812.1 ABC transporter substrate-binding protein [Actinomadura xylanilytica]
MSRMIRGAGLVLAAALALSACGGGDDGGDPLKGGDKGSGGTVTVGSADFAESELLGEIYAQAMEAKGVKVARKFKIGAREVYYGQVESGAIQVFPEYNGALLARVDKTNTTAATTEDVDTALKQKLPPALEILDPSKAEDKDALVVTAETAAKYKLKTIEDLKPVAKDLVVGGPPEFKTRQQGMLGLEKVYGLTFKQFKSLDTGPITLANLKKGQIQAGNLFTTNPAITKDKLVPLEDPKNLFGAQNVLPLVYKSKVDDTARQALNAVSAKLTTQDLIDMNGTMETEKADPEDVAKEWLKKAGLV